MNLDPTDLQLLSLLQDDNRRTVRDLAAAVGVSAPTCLRRMRRLRNKRVIRADAALVDPNLVGYGVSAFLEINLHSTSAAALQQFEGRMKQHPLVMKCCEITGAVDYMLMVIAADLSAFSEFTQEILNADSNIAGLRTHLVMNSVKNEHRLPLA